MEGMICTRMRRIQSDYHFMVGTRMNPKWRTRSLILKLLEATHGQWNYWNVQIHDSVAGTQATLREEAIQRKIEEQMEMGKKGLLKEDHWMMEVNLGDLETTSGEQEEYWLVAIRAAREAAILTRQQNQRTWSLLKMGIKISQLCKSLCMQGCMAFSSQSYQGQIVLEGE